MRLLFFFKPTGEQTRLTQSFLHSETRITKYRYSLKSIKIKTVPLYAIICNKVNRNLTSR